MSASEIQVIYEATPNPQTMKFVVASSQPIADRTANFPAGADTTSSPLARKLFGFPWAAGVFVGQNFVTVTKQEWVDWQVLAEPLADLIAEHVRSGMPVLVAAAASATGAPNPDSQSAPAAANESPTTRLIRSIIDSEIRPAVAMDGGDIVFSHFEQGIVYLHMQGSCSGCPSSTYTLKEGIETRLKQAVPEVIEVVAI